MMDLIADLHLEPLFNTHVAGMNGRRRVFPAKPAQYSRTSPVESIQELSALLQHLGLRADTPATQCFAHVDGATARATKNIADWLGYLPEDCVKAMVSDGWHWST